MINQGTTLKILAAMTLHQEIPLICLTGEMINGV